MEYLPLYEAKMIHHFDHRWASYQRADGRDIAVDVVREDKHDADFAVLPRYWVEAREVRLRVTKLPKELLTALRDRDANRIALAICYLLFLEWLYRSSGKSVDRATATAFPRWIDFVAYHPFARDFAPTQMGLCRNSHACLAPLGPSYLPAEAINKIEAGPCSSTAWYTVDLTSLRESLVECAPYTELLRSVPSLRSEGDVSAFAEELLSRASPGWLMGWRNTARSTDVRTVVGGVFPFSAVGNNLPIWTTDSRDSVILPALLSSFVCDYAARLKVGGAHLNFFSAEQLPVLRPGGVRPTRAVGHR